MTPMDDAGTEAVDARDHATVGIFLRGLLMGAADVVPGVSGGTMAFITGIYGRLLAAISAADLALLRQFLRGDWRGAWTRVDGLFLTALLLGIATSILSLARVITHLLEAQPLPLWAFFFGLILASAFVLLRHVQGWTAARVGGLLAGICTAAFIGLSPALSLPLALPSYFLAGFIAICAMILPGISGSFILVLLGMYAPVLAAIESLDFTRMALFAVGAGCGLLAFARLLRRLLTDFHATTLATLTGFLAGSLPVVWPWKMLRDDGTSTYPVTPMEYAISVGDSRLLLCLGLVAFGFFAVWLLESRWGGLER
jgi:putative membrane protein